MSRFTLDGSLALDQRIAADCAAVAAALVDRLGADQLDALVLGGGYGRGEGGVLAGDRPFNDYDLVLIHRGIAARTLKHHLDAVQRHASAAAGVHVDITPLHRGRLARLPPALTWFELAQGHRVIWGDAAVLAPLASRTLAGVHPSEWGRLLLNRAFGVALARRRRRHAVVGIGHDEPEVPFCLRQAMKAWLALGDVWLADRGAYAISVVARRAAMLALTDQPPWCARWLAAVDFKLHPLTPDDWPGLDADLAQVADLLGPVLAARPVVGVHPVAACAATVRHLPPVAWWPPWRHPRERLRIAALAELRGDSVDWPACERLWSTCG